jgi:glycosyltransferase involved in cell wall biosynthesis
MINDLVSVIMPCFNCESFVEDAIKSVKAQTYSNWELLIVDDFSSDSSAALVKKYLTDKRIKLFFNKKNIGGAAARNFAIEKASGRYIAFLDADDVWDPNKLDMQLLFMKRLNIGFSFSGYTTISENSEVISFVKPPRKVTFKKMLKHNYIGCLTVIYDTNPYGKVFMPLIKKRQDYALWLKLLKNFDAAYSLQENLGYYRIREESLSTNKLDALKYYWRVLRSVANLSIANSLYNSFIYLLIVAIKKKMPWIYNKILIK